MPLAVCATPIGNLEDVTLRVLRELRQADVVLCEDTRRTRILLDRHGIAAQLVSYHEHNEARRVAEVLPRLVAGQRVALVTDAGLPGISDPGLRLVDAALEAGVAVSVLPGATAIETAIVASGFEAERYQFLGFLPRGERALASLWAELERWPWVAVAYESPRRLGAALAALARAQPERRVAVCRELTKLHEEVVRGPASELAARFAEPVKGEVTIVIGPAPAVFAGDEEGARSAVAELVAGGAPRRLAAEVVARLSGLSKNRLYRDSL